MPEKGVVQLEADLGLFFNQHSDLGERRRTCFLRSASLTDVLSERTWRNCVVWDAEFPGARFSCLPRCERSLNIWREASVLRRVANRGRKYSVRMIPTTIQCWCLRGSNCLDMKGLPTAGRTVEASSRNLRRAGGGTEEFLNCATVLSSFIWTWMHTTNGLIIVWTSDREPGGEVNLS